jgi:uncharacterized membrane-anchored protein
MKLRFESKTGSEKIIAKKKKDRQAETKVEEARKLLLKMHEDGAIDASSYGDPVEWQRETRQDRPLPFRD